jgi:polysaccharide export outer membrane protein
MKKFALFFILSLVIFSCTTRKEIVYFRDIDTSNIENLDKYNEHLKINVNDILNINVRTLNPQASLQFSQSSIGGQGGQGGGGMRADLLKISGYLVHQDGTIDFPQIGSIDVKGKSTREVQKLLESKLKKFLKNPIVSVRVINYKFTILGEVRAPGTYEILEENFTLLQALGMAGGLTINGKRKNILIIRHQDGERITKRIDLTTTEWMNSPFYFVKQNDQIYVEPNNPQVKRAGYVTDIGTALSVLSVILSVTVIIFR